MYASIQADIHTLQTKYTCTQAQIHTHTYTYIYMYTYTVHSHGLISIIYLIYRIVTGVSKMRSGCIPIIYILLIRDKSIYRVTNVLRIIT